MLRLKVELEINLWLETNGFFRELGLPKNSIYLLLNSVF